MNLPFISPEYVVVRHIESGGQADVYEVRHLLLGGVYAARVLREAWDALARHDFEKCIWRQLRAAGPRVVPVIAFDTTASRPFMIMEYMPRGSLADEILRRLGRFELTEALSIAESLAMGLVDAHAKGLAHGDFKPGNVLRNASGSWVLSDFGSAVTVGANERFCAPRWANTPAYAAPEQLRGITMQASDIYALGIVLHELLTANRTIVTAELVDIAAFHGPGAAGVAELLARFTAQEPHLRPTAREAANLIGNAKRLALLGRVAPLPALRAAASAASQLSAAAQRSSQSVPGWLKAIGTIGTILGAAAIVNRSTKSWDGKVGRYRGSDGQFRGNGLFE